MILTKIFDPDIIFWFQCFYVDLGNDENGHPINENLWHFRKTSRKLLNTLSGKDPLAIVKSPERKAKVELYRTFYSNPANIAAELSPFPA